jgi:hypothetical protein
MKAGRTGTRSTKGASLFEPGRPEASPHKRRCPISRKLTSVGVMVFWSVIKHEARGNFPCAQLGDPMGTSAEVPG